jgi:UDP-glucuronate decarboxylase
MKRVIVTGAAGFLGSHIAMHHLNAGDEVIGVDNFCSSLGTLEMPSAHFTALRSHKSNNFKFLRSDISWNGFTDELYNFTYFQGTNVIYNFACPASPPRYQQLPVETMMTCVAGTRNVLKFAQMTGGGVVVHASTSEVYGDPDRSPQEEAYHGNVNSYGPRACYDEGKRAAEALCYDYLHKYKVDARMVRIFNTYGPHMDPEDGRVVSNFICQALRGEKLTIYGKGTQTRSFCYVDDLVRGIVGLGALGENPMGPINLGNPNEFTIYELAQNVISNLNTYRTKEPKELDISASVIDKPLPVDDPLQRRPNIARAKQFLGWEPTVQLTEGLDKTIAYFKTLVK